MPNDFYTPTGNPTDNSNIVSPDVRSEFTAINAGFNKLPTLTGNANKLVCVNSSGTGMDVTTAPTVTSIAYNGVAVSGYTTGAGGAVTQLTSKTTAVTLDKPCGYITTHDASMIAGEIVVFQFNNALISGRDVLSANISNGNGWKYAVRAYNFNVGYCYIAIKNDTAGVLAEALPISFIIHRAVGS